MTMAKVMARTNLTVRKAQMLTAWLRRDLPTSLFLDSPFVSLKDKADYGAFVMAWHSQCRVMGLVGCRIADDGRAVYGGSPTPIPRAQGQRYSSKMSGACFPPGRPGFGWERGRWKQLRRHVLSVVKTLWTQTPDGPKLGERLTPQASRQKGSHISHPGEESLWGGGASH